MENYWLFKTEPSTFSIDDLAKVPQEPWDGIRNYQARNFLRDECKIGDKIIIYHSSCDIPAAVGLAEVASEPYPDETAFDPKSNYFDPKSKREKPTWILVDLKFLEKFNKPVPLSDMRNDEIFEGFRLLMKGNRLSLFPVEKKYFDRICFLGRI